MDSQVWPSRMKIQVRRRNDSFHFPDAIRFRTVIGVEDPEPGTLVDLPLVPLERQQAGVSIQLEAFAALFISPQQQPYLVVSASWNPQDLRAHTTSILDLEPDHQGTVLWIPHPLTMALDTRPRVRQSHSRPYRVSSLFATPRPSSRASTAPTQTHAHPVPGRCITRLVVILSQTWWKEALSLFSQALVIALFEDCWSNRVRGAAIQTTESHIHQWTSLPTSCLHAL